MSNAPVSDVTGRLDLRRRFSRRHRLLLLGVGVTVLALTGGLIWLVAGSSVLAVQQVRVEGVKVLTADEVKQAAAAPVGRPLVWVDPGGIADRVAGLPAVAKVSVSRGWPNALAIVVTERTPMFVVEAGGGFLVVDGDGVAFQAVAVVPKGLTIAQADATATRVLKDLGTVLSALDPGLRAQVRRIRATTPDSIILELTSGVQIVWGSAEQSELKSQVISALMKVHKASRYDVSSPSNPVAR